MSKRVKMFFGWCTGIAAVLTVLYYAGVLPVNVTSQINQKGSQNVASQNQSGGLAVGKIENSTIVIPSNSKPRHVTDKTRETLNRLDAYKGTRISLCTVLNDGEAIGFAEETKAYLLERGHNIDGVSIALWRVPPTGQHIYVKKDGSIDIVVGIQPLEQQASDSSPVGFCE